MRLTMREIKFRGKRVDNGEWVTGYYVCIGEKYHYIYTDKVDLIALASEKYLVIPETVGQYTGIEDDNGTEIYEGDIIAAFDDDGNMDCYSLGAGEVKFCRGEWCIYDGSEIKFCRGEWCIYDGSNESLYNFCEVHIVEVIGNIHDTPELMEEVTR